jgi:hypothetical protein
VSILLFMAKVARSGVQVVCEHILVGLSYAAPTMIRL